MTDLTPTEVFVRRLAVVVAYRAKDTSLSYKAIKEFFLGVQKDVLENITLKDMATFLRKRPTNRPKELSSANRSRYKPSFEKGQGYAVRVKISPTFDDVSIELYSAYRDNRLKPVKFDPVQSVNKLEPNAVRTIDKALRALFAYIAEDHYRAEKGRGTFNQTLGGTTSHEPIDIEEFLGDCELTGGCAMTRNPDGSLELVGASGFMPNAGARLLYDGDPDKLPHGLSEAEMPYFLSGLADQVAARMLNGNPIPFKELYDKFVDTPGLSLN